MLRLSTSAALLVALALLHCTVCALAAPVTVTEVYYSDAECTTESSRASMTIELGVCEISVEQDHPPRKYFYSADGEYSYKVEYSGTTSCDEWRQVYRVPTGDAVCTATTSGFMRVNTQAAVDRVAPPSIFTDVWPVPNSVAITSCADSGCNVGCVISSSLRSDRCDSSQPLRCGGASQFLLDPLYADAECNSVKYLEARPADNRRCGRAGLRSFHYCSATDTAPLPDMSAMNIAYVQFGSTGCSDPSNITFIELSSNNTCTDSYRYISSSTGVLYRAFSDVDCTLPATAQGTLYATDVCLDNDGTDEQWYTQMSPTQMPFACALGTGLCPSTGGASSSTAQPEEQSSSSSSSSTAENGGGGDNGAASTTAQISILTLAVAALLASFTARV